MARAEHCAKTVCAIYQPGVDSPELPEWAAPPSIVTGFILTIKAMGKSCFMILSMNTKSAIAPPKRKPRMHDIAAAAHVSIGTVSRALNGKPDVSPDLAERVTQAASSMGYCIRGTERQPSKGFHPVSNVGYIVDSANEAVVASEAFQQDFLSGVEQTVMDRGGHLIFSSCRNEILKNTVPAMIVEKLVSGVILKVNNETSESWILKISRLVPTVLLMHRSFRLPLSSVMCDNRGAVYQTLQHLRDLGHTKIGFFFENEASPRINSMHHDERLEAFIKCSAILGLNQDAELVQSPVRDSLKNEDLSHVAGAALKQFLALKDRCPTAVVCATDTYAMALIRAAQVSGLNVPGDLSVTGIINTAPCEFSNPTLTSVSLSEVEIGRAAVDLLVDRIERPLANIREVTVGANLVARESSAPPGPARKRPVRL